MSIEGIDSLQYLDFGEENRTSYDIVALTNNVLDLEKQTKHIIAYGFSMQINCA